MTFYALTIVSSCRGYGKYLSEWATSIVRQTVRPGAVCLFTHGSPADAVYGKRTVQSLVDAGITATHRHSAHPFDFGSARNAAVEMATTEWVMHLDCDDTLMPTAVEDFMALSPNADVIAAGYERSGSAGPSKRARLYKDVTGEDALTLPSICSGISPFRKSFWEQAPYRTDMLGAWDTALWIGFARLGVRFRATTRATFTYRQHDDSIFNTRRKVLGWTRVHTTAMLNHVRANRSGVHVIVPRDLRASPERDAVWTRVRAHYAAHHPDWTIVEGRCASPLWIKGAAIHDALLRSRADVIVIADADCLVDPSALRTSVDAVSQGAPWAMPHHMVYRATDAMTPSYLSSDPVAPLIFPDAHSTERVPYVGCPGGGIVVMRRVSYDAIGGIPLAFRGWGSEDRALACLADTLLGPCVRGTADLLHLWHPPQEYRARPNGNLQLLRQLGHAALRGRDALVAMVYTLPNPGSSGVRPESSRWKTHVGTARPAAPVEPIDLNAIARRHAELRSRRR